MLACQHRSKTGTEERFAATGPARPIAGAAVAHKRKVLVVDIGGTRVKLIENAFLGGIRLWKPQGIRANKSGA
jgi:hypothetical protein